MQVLRSRAAASIALGDINDAIVDYKASNQLSPSGEIQLGICFIEKNKIQNPMSVKLVVGTQCKYLLRITLQKQRLTT